MESPNRHLPASSPMSMNTSLKLRLAVMFVSAAIPLALGVATSILAAHGFVMLPLDNLGVGPH